MAASPNFSHMLPTVFDRPESYEPDRFAPPREEDKRKPFSFIGFGGGRHACIGQNFAYLQVGAPGHCREREKERGVDLFLMQRRLACGCSWLCSVRC